MARSDESGALFASLHGAALTSSSDEAEFTATEEYSEEEDTDASESEVSDPEHWDYYGVKQWYAPYGYITDSEEPTLLHDLLGDGPDLVLERDRYFHLEPFVQPIDVGRPRQALPLPTELLHLIVDELARKDILSIAMLAQTCRKWYATIRDDPGWEQRARDLGASRVLGHTDWKYTWRYHYCLHCRNCKAKALPDPGNDFDHRTYPYYLGEPRTVRLCEVCHDKREFVDCVYGHEHELCDEEYQRLALKRDGVGKFHSIKTIDEYVAEKRKRRLASIRDLVRDCIQDTELIPEWPVSEGAFRHYPSSEQKAWKKLCRQVAEPSRSEIESWLRLRQDLRRIEETVLDAARSRSMDLVLVNTALDWLCAESVPEKQRGLRDDMSRWRNELHAGRQTVESFLKEIADPQISHAAYDCKTCGYATPALACVKRMCRRCCSGGTGCPRHAGKPNYVPSRSYWYWSDWQRANDNGRGFC